jgi:hypothetical protein
MDSNINKQHKIIENILRNNAILASKYKEIRYLEAVQLDLVDELRPICNHPITNEDTKHIEGGYLDRSETTTTISCEFCKKELRSNTSTGGYS